MESHTVLKLTYTHRALVGAIGISLLLAASTCEAKKKHDGGGGGRRTVTFTENHPESAPAKMKNRISGNIEGGRKYKIAGESYQLVVPDNYDAKKRYGLLVWINSSDNGAPPRSWAGVMTKYNMIAIGANKSGNEQSVFGRRIPLAVDAVHNVMKQYSIDERRIYVAGFSGGGRCASITSIMYADIFKGALYVCGCNSWSNSMYPNKMTSKVLKENRYVLLTGTKDFNQKDTQGVLARCYKSGFKYQPLYIEVPELSHRVPGGEWFEKALLHLDAPIIEEEKRFLAAAKKELASIKARGTKPEELIPFIKKCPSGSEIKKEAMAVYVAEGKKRIAQALGREKKNIKELHGIIEHWGIQPFAKEAKAEFNKLGEKVLADMDTKKAPDSKYLRFIRYWQGCPCTKPVIERYNGKAEEAARKLLASSEPANIRGNIANTAYRLSSFIKKYNGLPAVDKVRNRLSQFAAKEFARIKGLKSSFSRKTSLRNFVRDYAGCPEADEAQEMLSSMR